MLGFALPPRSLGPRKLRPAVGKHRLRRPTGVHWTPVVEPVGSNWIHPPAQIQKAPRGGLLNLAVVRVLGKPVSPEYSLFGGNLQGNLRVAPEREPD